MKRLAFIVLLSSLTLYAQEPATAPPSESSTPTLNEMQKLKVQVAIQRVQIAQQQLQLINAELDRARSDAQTLLTSLTVKDYQLNLDTLTYAPMPEKK